ncbi:hypothetical protein BLS_001858 [Venturia inaequalis]|uniref:Uncharacterized protein n=1 Tax=Venturia inaequalis TaxID=5025 RepID=A0A8H3UGU3_VENIN|nr:hypothetical protein EG328_006293 [Venturia inaequalis]KAE9976790.1 hypothetical protein BLS_001858 [Venturia inaequalis]RDI84155.1 hypothetical protein Vi05172_g6036 [Venturia inaequalis]
MVKLSSVAAFLTAASSVAVADWHIINWEAGCARSGCFYIFNVTGPASEDGKIPSFGASCNAYEYRKPQAFTPCGINDSGAGNRGVSAKFVPRVEPNGILEKVAVSFAFTDLKTGAVRNFTGTTNIQINQFVAPRQNYTISDIKENIKEN